MQINLPIKDGQNNSSNADKNLINVIYENSNLIWVTLNCIENAQIRKNWKTPWSSMFSTERFKIQLNLNILKLLNYYHDKIIKRTLIYNRALYYTLELTTNKLNANNQMQLFQ